MSESKERKLLGEQLSLDEKVSLAQLTVQPGWKILVGMMAEACRSATEDVIKLNPASPSYRENVVSLQMIAHAMNKFSRQVLDSCKVHHQVASKGIKEKEDPASMVARGTRFQGFRPPQPQQPQQSPTEGEATKS